MPVKLVFGGKLTLSDPKDFPVVIVGQLPHLTSISFDDVKIKLSPRVDKEVSKYCKFYDTVNQGTE